MELKITVVIVTYNGAIWLEKNLNSLQKSNYPLSIMIVDNASTDNTLEIASKFPQVEIIKSEINLGFGKANNLGIIKALENGADAVFLLNQDTWVYENTLSILIKKLNSNPDFGILSPMHYSANEITLDENFQIYYNRKIAELSSEKLAVVPFVNAAAWLISKKCIEKVGLFEPIFNHYGEDRNYCDRVCFHGFKIGIAVESAICHDRTIVRNFKKDILQSQYKVFNALLNINQSLFNSYLYGFKEVVGLPKFFFRFYGFNKSVHILFSLFIYYMNLLFDINKISKTRKDSKAGKTGTLLRTNAK